MIGSLDCLVLGDRVLWLYRRRGCLDPEVASGVKTYS